MKLKIFFSWQTASDTKHLHNKPFILSCINKAIGEIENKGELKGVYFEVQEGTTSEAGTPEMIATCEKRIDECHIFIADFTVERRFCRLERGTLSYGGKKLREHQNTNVAYEFGRASHRLPTEQIITVMNTVNGSPKEDDKRFLAIDFRHRRWPITFHLTRDKREADTDEAYDKAQKALVEDLKKAIQSSALAAIEHMDEQVKPFMRWEVQRRGTSFRGKFFWNDQLREVQRQILENKKVLRLLGLSGMGKTHLVNEAFGKDNFLKKHYLYIDCYSCEYNDFRARLDWLFINYREAYLVFDNCDQEIHQRIINLRRELQGSNPILTIYNNPMEESSGGSATYLMMERAYDDIIESILSDLPSLNSQVDLDKIKEFSGGIPMIARLLAEGIRREQNIGIITDASLMDKVLGVKQWSEERAVLQALSLFSFVGYRDEYAAQLEFLAKHRKIAMIAGDDEQRHTVFDRTIQYYLQRGIIEAKGRLVGIRITPIALYLCEEWLNTCSPDQFYQILKDLQNSPSAHVLTEAFCTQFRYLGKSHRARQLVADIAGPNRPLAHLNEITSNYGSRLLRSFSEVNPEIVAQTLEHIIGIMTAEQLQQLDEGRCNIIWTIEKLCFDPSTFTRGALMLLRLAIVEDEAHGCSAMDRFIGLFSLILPGTSVPLLDRLAFLTKQYKHPDRHQLLLKAIRRALRAQDYHYSCGAEVRGLERLEHYYPQSDKEIDTYLKGCLELLMKIMKQGFSMVRYTCETLSQALQEWSRLGRGLIIWPYVLDMAKYLNYDWDTMYDSLCLMVAEQDKQTPQDLLYEYQRLLNKLEKQDFFSRYIRAGKHYKLLPYEEMIEKIKLNYVALGKEMAEDHLYTVEMLTKIYGESSTHNYQFGSAVAEHLSEPDQRTFIENSITALNSVKQSDIHTLIAFLYVVKETVFEFAFEAMKELRDKSTLFKCVGVRGYALDSPYAEQLFKLVQEGVANVEMLKGFYYTYHTEEETIEGVRLELLKRISQLPNSLPIVLELAQPELLYNQGRDMLVAFIEGLLLDNVERLLDYPDKNLLWHTVEELLKRECSPQFATAISKALVLDSSHWGYISHGEYKCTSHLLSNYFDEAWPVFSAALLNQRDDLLALRCRPPFSPFREAETYSAIFLNLRRRERVLQWCDQHRNRAPKRLLEMLPLYDEAGDRFSDFVITLIDRYGDQEGVLKSLGCNMGSFSWVGSLVPLYEKQLSCITPLTEHPIEAVRVWARRTQSSLKEKIRRETNTDEERSALYR